MKKLQIAIFTISLTAALPASAALLVDRGLPTANLNDAELTNHDFLEALRDLSSPRALVIREGQGIERAGT